MKLNLGILNPDTPIYRIVDFFDAIALLQTKLLRFSRISKFSDENEGIDLLLHALFLSHGPCKGAIGYSWKTTEDAILHHKLTQSRFYACCWTGDPDSIAFCEEVGLDYVSCSPYRVPIARLAAAQATLLKLNKSV